MDQLWSAIAPVLMLISGGLIVYILMRNRQAPPDSGKSGRTESEKLFQIGFDKAPIGIAYLATDGSWIHANARLLQLLGYERSEFNRTSLRNLTHTEDRKREAGMMAAVRSGRSRGFTLNKRLRKADGTFQTFRFSISRLGGGGGAVFQCIIDEAAAERDSQSDIVAALDGVPEISVVGLDGRGMVSSWNRGAQELFGYTADEMMGRPWTRLHTRSRGKAGEANRELAIAAADGRFEGTETRKRNDEEVISVEVAIIPLFRGRDLVGFVEISRDTTLNYSAREYKSSYERQKHLDAERIDMLTGSNEQLRRELDRHAELEAALRDAQDRLKAANRELTGRVRMLSAAVRKLIDQRKSLKETLRMERESRDVASEELASTLPHDLEWKPIRGSAIGALYELAHRGLDGVAVFRTGEKEKRFTIRSGSIAACSSNSPALLLGQLLVETDHISEAERQKMIDVQEQTEIAFGRLLVLFELMSEEQIRLAMQTKIERELEELRSWTDVEVAFFQSEIEPHHIVSVEVEIEDDTIGELSVEPATDEPVHAPATGGERMDPSAESLSEATTITGNGFIASSKATKFHRKQCSFVNRIQTRSRITFSTASEAESSGLTRCRNCLS